MPVAGRKPKPDGFKRNRVKPVYDWVEVNDVVFTEGPRLPRSQPSGLPWSKATKAWWQAVSTMPHCVLWETSDWQFAMDTALVAAAFHAGDGRAAAELRAREKVLGTTVDARRDLRIRYVAIEETEEEVAGVTSLADYRASLE